MNAIYCTCPEAADTRDHIRVEQSSEPDQVMVEITDHGTSSSVRVPTALLVGAIERASGKNLRQPLEPKRAPNGPQKYRGCQEHGWEDVVPAEDANDSQEVTQRLRVPGGWLYKVAGQTTFVPMPEAVGYEI